MKDLRIDDTTLHAPDNDGDVEIEMWTEESGNSSVWVPFDVLEKWVTSIRGKKEKKNHCTPIHTGDDIVCSTCGQPCSFAPGEKIICKGKEVESTKRNSRGVQKAQI